MAEEFNNNETASAYFWGIAVGIILTLSISFFMRSTAIKTLPDGKKFVQINFRKYWVEKWIK